MQRAIRIGITGKIGSGKSTLLALMEERGIAVVNSDRLARALMENDPTLREKITRLLGDGAYSGDQLDRSFVASKIFSDTALREKVEGVVHPAVTREIEGVFAAAPPGRLVAVESALILQTNFRTHFDYIILIDASDDAVLARLTANGRISEADARNRLAEQHWESVSRDDADFTIDNSDTQAEFESRCRALLSLLDLLVSRELPEAPLHGVET